MEDTYNDSSNEIVNDDVETVEAVETNTVDDMTEDEFNKHFEEVGTDDKSEKPGDEVVENLDDAYKTQITDTEAKLDKPILLKVNGEVVSVDNINDLKNMAEQSVGVTKKFQQISEHKNTIEFMKSNDINMEDLSALVQQRGQEVVTPPNADEVEIEEVANSILESSYVQDFQNAMNVIPDDVKTQIQQNPQMLKAIAVDFESGLAQQIVPQLNRVMSTKGMSFQDAYVHIGQKIQNKNEEVQTKRKILKSEPKQTTQTVNNSVDVWDMDSKQFDKYFNNL